jgi:hypothetical protein
MSDPPPNPELDELAALVARLAAAFDCLPEHRARLPWVARLDESWTLVANVGFEPSSTTRQALLVDGSQVAVVFGPGGCRGTAKDIEDGRHALRVCVENAEACRAIAESSAAELADAANREPATADTEPPPAPPKAPWDV